MQRRFTLLVSWSTVALAAVVGGIGLAHGPSLTDSSSAGGLFEPLRPRVDAPARARVLRAAGGTYIGRMLLDRDSTLSRWKDRTDDPIRVWLEPSGLPGFTEGVHRAFGEWSGIGLPIRFVFVDRARDAEIEVRWTERLERKTGNTVWRVDHRGWMRGSEVILATRLADGRRLDARSLRAIALHEIGHAIGMAHSDASHDVMAPLVRVASLSEGDRATARLLYTLPAGHLR
jgi:hypothetical protein